MDPDQDLATVLRYLNLAERLRAVAGERPAERSQLSYAADVAAELANLTDTDDATIIEWIETAASLLEKELDGGSLDHSVVASAGDFARMARERRRAAGES